jgi:hypothetical protein
VGKEQQAFAEVCKPVTPGGSETHKARLREQYQPIEHN